MVMNGYNAVHISMHQLIQLCIHYLDGQAIKSVFEEIWVPHGAHRIGYSELVQNQEILNQGKSSPQGETFLDLDFSRFGEDELRMPFLTDCLRKASSKSTIQFAVR